MPESDDGGFTRMVGPEFRRWLDQMRGVNGCAEPVYLVGHSTTRDAVTGELVHVYTSSDQAYGRLAVPCRNRRESRCPSCAYIHKGDTLQIVIAGLSGGKGVPPEVAEHPRVFVTLTAPSFGAVHRTTDHGGYCHPWRKGVTCPHGVLKRCPVVHAEGDARVGSALCEECYRFDLAVLWNGSAGRLWNEFCIQTRRRVSAATGIPVARLREHVRVSFAKVVEFQRRGLIHFHAVIRFDGPEGPASRPPEWADERLLMDAIGAAVALVAVKVPDPVVADGVRVLGLGAQFDVRPIVNSRDSEGMGDLQAARYIAKYLSKGDVPGLVLDHRVNNSGQIEQERLGRQGRLMMRACWELGDRPQYAKLNLHLWTNQLGFRGNVATKSRAWSSTYAQARAERAAYRRQKAEVVEPAGPVVVESRWQFDRQGHHSIAEKAYAVGVADEVAERRTVRRRRRDRAPESGG